MIVGKNVKSQVVPGSDLTTSEIVTKFLENKGKPINLKGKSNLLYIKKGQLFSCSALLAKYNYHGFLGIRGDADNLIHTARHHLKLVLDVLEKSNIKADWTFKVEIGDVIPLTPPLKRIK